MELLCYSGCKYLKLLKNLLDGNGHNDETLIESDVIIAFQYPEMYLACNQKKSFVNIKFCLYIQTFDIAGNIHEHTSLLASDPEHNIIYLGKPFTDNYILS